MHVADAIFDRFDIRSEVHRLPERTGAGMRGQARKRRYWKRGEMGRAHLPSVIRQQVPAQIRTRSIGETRRDTRQRRVTAVCA
jgi:hypothetical protein